MLLIKKKLNKNQSLKRINNKNKKNSINKAKNR